MGLEAESRETNSAVIAVEKDGTSAATIHQIDAALRLASKNKGPGDRRRPNPLASVLDSVILSILRNMPAERANAAFEEIVRHHPEISSEMRISLLRHIQAQATKRSAVKIIASPLALRSIFCGRLNKDRFGFATCLCMRKNTSPFLTS